MCQEKTEQVQLAQVAVKADNLKAGLVEEEWAALQVLVREAFVNVRSVKQKYRINLHCLALIKSAHNVVRQW